MIAHILADLVLLVHLAFILFVIIGGFAVLYRRWLAWVHLPAVLWAGVVNLAGWVCPLTWLEHGLRRAAGEAGYQGGFVAHYLLPLIYPAWMRGNLVLIVGVSVVLWNVLVYVFVLYCNKRRR